MPLNLFLLQLGGSLSLSVTIDLLQPLKDWACELIRQLKLPREVSEESSIAAWHCTSNTGFPLMGFTAPPKYALMSDRVVLFNFFLVISGLKKTNAYIIVRLCFGGFYVI